MESWNAGGYVSLHFLVPLKVLFALVQLPCSQLTELRKSRFKWRGQSQELL